MRSTGPRWVGRRGWAVSLALLGVLAASLFTVGLVRAQPAKPKHYISPEERFLDILAPDKRAVAERWLQQRAAAEAQAVLRPTAVVKGPPAPPAPGSLPERPRGIIAESQAPLSSEDVKVDNQWQDQMGGEWVHAYAGVAAHDPTQGVVVVLAKSGGGTYPTPSRSGSVHFTSANATVNATRLTLEATTGATFVFDVTTRAFVSP